MFQLIKKSAFVAVLSTLAFGSLANDQLDSVKSLASIVGDSAKDAKLTDACSEIVEQYKKDKTIEIPSECREKVEELVSELSKNEDVKEQVGALTKSLF